MSLSEEMFDKLSKKDMWRMYSESVKKEEEMLTKIKADTTAVLERLSATEDRLVKVESELAIVKNTNHFLKNEISRVQTQQLKDNQYGRLENVEVSGIPADVQKDDLENKVISIGAAIDVTLAPSDISACHRLGNSTSTIVRFLNRKKADALFSNARKLKDLDLSGVLGGAHAPVYINPNLCPALKAMWAKAKRVKEAGFIAFYGSNRRGVFVKKSGEKDARQYPVFVDEDFLQFLPNDAVLADIIAKR